MSEIDGLNVWNGYMYEILLILNFLKYILEDLLFLIFIVFGRVV